MIDYNDPESIRSAMNRHADEMLDFATGLRSWSNLVMDLGNNGADTQVAIARMDAAEVEKHAAAIEGLAALLAARRT